MVLLDLTKGMTNQSDAERYISSRVSYLKSLADNIWEVNPNAYVIFEHFQNAEEQDFSDYGILSWGKFERYSNAAMDKTTRISEVSITAIEDITNPPLSVLWKAMTKTGFSINLQFGNRSGSYNIQTPQTAYDRLKLAAAFFSYPRT